MDINPRLLLKLIVLTAVLYLLVSCDPSTPIPNNPTDSGILINWQGELDSYPSNPKEGYAFYYTVEGSSYIYVSGEWKTLAKSGSGLTWLGEYPDYPTSPSNGDIFYHTVLGNSYVYDGTAWELLARSGNDGVSGLLNWMGSFPAAPDNPAEGWAYHNEASGISYIYSNNEWKIFSYDGQSIVWLGELSTAPTSPSANMAYFNTMDNTSYIWNGYSWSTLAGNSNVYYKVSIIWKGDLASAPNDPAIGWMYYNTLIGKSYIWTGAAWEVVAADGISPIGFLIQWKGSHSAHPETPQIGWAYHNTGNNSTYLYDGTNWCLMIRGENILSSFSTAKMQVKVDGEIVLPARTFSFAEAEPDLLKMKVIEITNIGSETLYFSDYSPLVSNTYTDIANFDLTNFKNELAPGESFSINLNYHTGQVFLITITLFNSSLDSPWNINFYNTVSSSTVQYLSLYSYFYPFSNINSSQSSKSTIFYASGSSSSNHSVQELDFGEMAPSTGNTPSYRFRLYQNIQEDIHLPGDPAIRISGEDAGSFQLVMNSNTNITIPPSADIDLFSIIFNPTTLGEKTATLHIPTDIEGIGEIQYQLVGTACENLNLFIENGYAPITFEGNYCYCSGIAQDGNEGLYLISESYYKNSEYYYEIIHMDSKGNSIDRFSIEADSYDPVYIEWSSNKLTVYSSYRRYTINTTTHSYIWNNYSYKYNTPQIDNQTYWRILQYDDYRFGLTSYSDGILIVFNNENEKLATYYEKLSYTSLADACVSGKYLYFAKDYQGSIVRRIDLDELIEDMNYTFF